MKIVFQNMLYWPKQHYNIIVAERQMLEVNVCKCIIVFNQFKKTFALFT